MSKDWTPEELQAVSAAMKAAGFMTYEEFCNKIEEKKELDSYGQNK